ncbi:hypothetical protein [Pedococcus sp. 5OH_020]|uniref:hypothetical protein n=1 Tax=Pedococcus sp. 5OH_020 TaxID=2989814 RepID=UPI0022E9AA17|nr:hypothetical protein [Pedococcus sp. 5OH_020]
MLYALTVVVFVASVCLMGLSGWYAVRSRLVDDRLLLVAALLELGLLVQLVVCLAHLGRVPGGPGERATFAAYAVTLPFVPPAAAFLALKEKTRWSMGVVAVGAFAAGVMTARLQQIWNLRG